MSCIVFETPGLIDLRAFTVMGMSAKPNSANPIGYFGTGLKHSISTLVRLGAEPVVFIGKDKYTFQKKATTFRGAPFEMLRMKINKWRMLKSQYTELPYTTQNARNWEPWMAFRELESNTRDEGGRTMLYEGRIEDACASNETVHEDTTTIIVDLPAFTQAYHERDNIFLPEAIREGAGVQVVPRPSEHLYWRGLKVFKLSKPALHTYNFLSWLNLTEDRTLADVYYARAVLARWLVGCERDDVIAAVLQAEGKFWEHGLDFPADVEPGAAFHRVMARYPKRVSAGAWGYYSRYDSRVVPETFKLDDKHPLPWRIDGNVVVDIHGRAVFDAPYNYPGKWELTAAAILRYVNPAAPAEEQNEFEPLGAEEEAVDESL